MIAAAKPLILALTLFAGAAPALAGSDGSAEPIWPKLAGFFSLAVGTPDVLGSALDAYAEHRPHAALGELAGAEHESELAAHREEIFLLRGLVLDDLGWRDEAAEAYAAVLGADPPSPYYPLALLRWVETRRVVGDDRAIAEGFRRWLAKPWQGKDERAAAIRNRLLSYGDLREAGPSTTAAERQLLATPARLVDLARDAKERPSERVVYLSGLSLFATGAYAEAIEALERIGISSPYYRYALFTGAQARFAAGEPQATRPLRRLASFPLRTPADVALEDRATLLEAQLRFAAEDVDGALARLTTFGKSSYGVASQLFRGDLCMEKGDPSLAVVYYRELDGRVLQENIEARRALGLGAAYAALGDFAAASTALRGGAERLQKARTMIDDDDGAGERTRLRQAVEQALADVEPGEGRARRRLAEGVARVAAAKGPFNLGRVVRVLFTSHANTILGQPVYDLSLLAESELTPIDRVERSDATWLAYLASRHRAKIEDAARAVRALRRSDGSERAWRAAEATAGVAGSAWRRQRIADELELPDDAEIEPLAARALESLERERDEGLREMLRDRAEGLRELQYEIETALSQTLGEAGDDLRPKR